jgi:hypothetical protein
MDIVSYIAGFYNTEPLNSVLGNLRAAVLNGTWQKIDLTLCSNLLDH